MKKLDQLVRGFVDTVPLGIGVSIYGLVYGVMGSQGGLSVWDVAAMSAFIFAGASQMTAVQMLALGGNPVSIILAVFIINLRHFLLAASLAPYLKSASTGIKMVNAFFMTDESYAATYSHFQKNPPSAFYFLGSGLNIYLFWGCAGVLGYYFGNIIPDPLRIVLDFAFVAAFIGMLVPMIKELPTVVTVLASAVISVLGCIYIPGKWYILIAGIGASLAGYAVSSDKRSGEASGEDSKLGNEEAVLSE